MDMKAESTRHDRAMRLPPFLSGPFRPFFLGGALWALAVLVLWICALSGAVTLPTDFEPLAWHRHEMLFGYLGAVIAGFLMTAISNWTGRPPIAGARLAALAGLWLAARFAMLFSASVGPAIAFALDVGFLLSLATLCGREVIAARNRNVPVVFIVLLLALASAADHAEANGLPVPAGLGWRGAFSLILLLIAIIGGRIIPAFTRNWLMKQGRTDGLPSQPGALDKVAIGVAALALGCWAVVPDARPAALLLLAAGALHVVRLARWSGLSAVRDPLVFILHVSYAWLPLGLLMLGASAFIADLLPTAALHALGAGAMASMTLAVMTRATLGHTGRTLRADRWTIAIYVLVTLGAAHRICAAILPIDYMRAIELAGLFWGGAFLLFVLAYGPKLVRSRVEGRA